MALVYSGEGRSCRRHRPVYFEQEGYPEALDNFRKALFLSEGRTTNELSSKTEPTNRRPATGDRKYDEAAAYYKKAIQQMNLAGHCLSLKISAILL